tara:strand:- start:635 stop:808 length:174 start_codon:yes stop_codon:yes gene_type:complete
MINITYAKYAINENNENCSVEITIDGITKGVPIDEANTDYQIILQWVADGNTIQEAD